MAKFTKSNNPELYSIIENSQNNASKIEKFDNNVYLISLPSSRVLNSFFLNLQLENDEYDYGIAYVDVLQEKITEHNRHFNTYAFYFEKNDTNTITQIIDVNESIYINFLKHPSFEISRTQNFDRFISDTSIYVPVFPEQDAVKKNDVYLPLFPFDITSLNLTGINSVKENDIYEIKYNSNKKVFTNFTERFDIFSNSLNIDKFNNTLVPNFYVDPMGMYGKEIQNALPYLLIVPTMNLAKDPSELATKSIGNELNSIYPLGASTGSTIASKSYLGDTSILRYCILRNKNLRQTGGIQGQFIKVSIDLYSNEAEPGDFTFSESGNDTGNPASSLYLTSGSSNFKTAYMESVNSDGNGNPSMLKIYILDKQSDSDVSETGIDLVETTSSIDGVNYGMNIIQSENLDASTPDFAKRKIISSSPLYSLINSFLGNFSSYFSVNPSKISEMFVVDYSYEDTSINSINLTTSYIQGSNQVRSSILSDGKYSIFTVRILWT